MRLTLRTLLAYLDEILEPKDAQEIGEKIKESEFAGNLLHRIRDVMRRLRLKSPEIDEPDTAVDPNTVAEYLDNTLPADRVPDFEKVCLESDMHLAEVASCHQILAMVLGEPAEIDPKSREHMYTLQQVAREQSEMEAAARVPESGEESPRPPSPPRPRPEIPEYLRERPKRKRQYLIAVALAAAGSLLAVFLAVGGLLEPLGIHSPLASREPAGEQLDEVAPAQAENNTASETEKSPEPLAVDVPADEQPLTAPPLTPAAAPAAAPDVAPAAAPAPLEPAAVAPSDVSPPAAAPPAEDQPPAAAAAQPSLPGEGVAAPPEPPADTPPAVAEPPADTPPAIAETPAETPAEKPLETPPAAPAPPELIGRFISDSNVLLRLAPGEKEWARIPAQDAITPGNELLSLPGFRPLIALTAGLTLRLVDGTRIAFAASNAADVPELKIAYGRVIVLTMGKPQARLALKLGEGAGQASGLLTFGDAETTLAVEVSRELAVGRNPEDEAASQLRVVFCVVTGQVQWAADGAEPVEIGSAQKLLLGGGESGKPAAMETSPDWIVADSVSLLDQKAAASAELELAAERPISLSLKELADHRKKEIRRLAISSLGHIGIFDQMAAMLNDPAQRLARDDYIADLRAALARGPQVAAQVREACERQFGLDAAALYRLLWGFSDEQLGAKDERLGTTNVDEMLVDCLDKDQLAFRVLGFWNLQNITGLGLYYQPEQPAVKRQQSVRNWRLRLKSGEIRYRKPAPAAAGKAEAETKKVQ